MRDIFTVIVAIVQIIVPLGFIGIFIFATYKDIKARRKRDIEAYGKWIAECIRILHGIEFEYQQNCVDITDRYFKQYMDAFEYGYRVASLAAMQRIVDKHRKAINEAKESYLNSEKVKEQLKWKGIRFATLPDYVTRAYENNISDIAHTFLKLNSCMDSYITDIKLAREYDKDPRTAREEREAEYQKELEDFINQYTETE